MSRPLLHIASLVLVTAACSVQSAPVASDHDPALTSGLTASAVGWIGDTHLRYQGRWIPSRTVMSQRALEVYTQTWPLGAAKTVTLFWSTNGAVSSRAMDVDREHAGAQGNNTQWRATIPADVLQDGRTIEYWLRATDAAGRVVWDSNNGNNHALTPRDEVTLFDGGERESPEWRMAGRGSFAVEGGVMTAQPGDGLGLYWSTFPVPPSFELTLDFRLSSLDDNSGVFLRFPDPDAFGYENAAWVGVHYGLEVQIDEIARPDGSGHHRTGALYEQPNQTLTPRPAAPPGQWNRYVIRVIDQTYSVRLQGDEVSRLVWSGDPGQPLRALPGGGADGPRFIGLQSHTGNVAFRDVRLRRL